VTDSWLAGRLSNFEYLLRLNILGGRSYHDGSNYPLVPWVVVDYSQLEDPPGSSFVITGDSLRDMRLPITAQIEAKRKELLTKVDPFLPVSDENCMFMAGPSNPTIVSHWLVRMQPFTELHKANEDGRFGLASRQFQSMARAVVQVLYGQSCWEHVPEMYSCPEIFVNFNGYDMGEGMGDCFTVVKGLDFIYLHRKALESEWASEHLPDWIDLIFGVKTICLEQCNVFSPLLLEDVWNDPGRQDKAEFVEQLLKTAGQLPQQLFPDLHPSKLIGFDSILVKTMEPITFDSAGSVFLDEFDVSYCALLSYDGNKALIALVNEFGAIFEYEIDIELETFERRLKRSEKWPSCIAARFDGGFVLLEKDSGHGIVLEATSTKAIQLAIESISMIGSNGEAIAVGNGLDQFVWWFVDDQTTSEVLFTLDSVQCFAISQSYGIIVFATLSGCYICDLESHQISFRCDLKGQIAGVLVVSEGFGFILVVCCDQSLMLFNVNGELIRTGRTKREIAEMRCFMDWSRFDYLVVADWNGKLRTCELFYLKFSKVFCRVNGRVVLLEFDPATASLFVVGKSQERLEMSRFTVHDLKHAMAEMM
jgi:hypothetical protein